MWKKLTTTNNLVLMLFVLVLLFVVDQYMNKDLFGYLAKDAN